MGGNFPRYFAFVKKVGLEDQLKAPVNVTNYNDQFNDRRMKISQATVERHSNTLLMHVDNDLNFK
ncbi:hypothetical protein [Flavivirga jejuensis]|uniref:Uncharacterized protein n=1 Tax=Flavivirga jejuensis TaxID=870487 RepID=A0ABT8WSE5_9FLAO|nr:hypothetical protein [Flavivirga jejuensis]MDO5976108.1 hypothetical protein [Flavivirga jejuensis]